MALTAARPVFELKHEACLLVMGHWQTSWLKEPSLLSERWESAPEHEPVFFFFSLATGAICIHSTRAIHVTAHAWQPATDHENKQRGVGDFDARHTLPVTDRQGRRSA